MKVKITDGKSVLCIITPAGNVTLQRTFTELERLLVQMPIPRDCSIEVTVRPQEAIPTEGGYSVYHYPILEGFVFRPIPSPEFN